jgi:peptide/nickel transport system permease protein
VTRWLIRRAAQGALTWAVAVTALFLLVRLLPGDPLAAAADLPPETRDALARLYGIDQPLLVQLQHFLRGLLQGDLGVSLLHGRPVTELLAAHLPATLLLGTTVLVANIVVALWLGPRLAARAGSAADRWTMRALLSAHGIPPFWLGLVLVWLFALVWRILPAGGVSDPLLDPAAGVLVRALDVAKHLFLPWLTLTLTTLVVPLRHHREAVLETLDADWVRAARAKGVAEEVVLSRHASRASLAPLLMIAGLWLPMILTGAVLVETTFSWPGIGWLMAESVGGRDYPMATGCVLIGTAAIVFGSVAADLAQRLFDPRVRE